MRQSAVFPFQGRKMRVYRPTEGQLLAIGVAGKRDPGESMARLWRVLEKLFVTPAGLAWGAAGSIGLQQSVTDRLATLEAGASPPEIRALLAAEVVPVQQAAVAGHVPHPGCEPPELACLFCWWDDGPHLLSVPRTGSDHQFHAGFAAIGSGDIFAALTVRSLIDPERTELTLDQAKLVAYRAIADAIDIAALFLGPPIQMLTLTAAGIETVPREELDEGIADAVELWKQRQREALGPLGGTPRQSRRPLTRTQRAARASQASEGGPGQGSL